MLPATRNSSQSPATEPLGLSPRRAAPEGELKHPGSLGEGLDYSSRSPGLSLVIPAYNEEHRLEPTLNSYLPVLEAMGVPFEVLVVVDGSDQTAAIAARYLDRNVCVERAHGRLGKGGALIHGFRQARFGTVGYVDADGSLSPEDLAELAKTVLSGEADCAIASRWLKESEWIRREPLLKRVSSRGFNWFVRSLLHLDVADTQCGAKFYSGEVIDRLLPQVTVTNLTSDVGFLFHATKDGARLREVPVTWDDKPHSRFNLGTMVPVMLLTVIGIRTMNSRFGKYVPPRLVAKFHYYLGTL